jgi:MscS family membrane protein
VGFGTYSLDIELFAYVRTSDWNEFLRVREELFLRVMELVAEVGSDFAFPSQISYFGGDAALDGRRAPAEPERAGERLSDERPPAPASARAASLPPGATTAGERRG